MTKEFKGVTYAESDKEAEVLLIDFCERIDFSRDWISDSTWLTTIGIARNKEYGVDAAEKAIVSDQQARQTQAAQATRRTKIADDSEEVLGQIDTVDFDDHAVEIFKQCKDQYVRGGGVNLTYGPKLTQARYDDLRGHWRRIGTVAAATDDTFFHTFSSMPVEDKAAKGKGSTGDTLERRGKQGNFFITVVNVRFNMHINVG